MIWVAVFLAIALAGAAVTAHQIVRLWRKAVALGEELDALGRHSERLAELLDQVGTTDRPRHAPADVH